MSYKTWQVSTCLKQSCQFLFTTYLFHIMVKCIKQILGMFTLVLAILSTLFPSSPLLFLLFSFLFCLFIILFSLFNPYDAIWYNRINSCQTWRNMLQIGQTSQALSVKKWRSNSLDRVGKLAIKNTSRIKTILNFTLRKRQWQQRYNLLWLCTNLHGTKSMHKQY